MRTSRIARDTARMAAALSPRTSRVRKAPSPELSADDSQDGDFDHSSPSASSSASSPYASPPTSSARKRKRGDTLSAQVKHEPASSPRTSGIQTNGKVKRARQPAKKVVGQNGHVKMEPPPNWERFYSLAKEMRSQWTAPVDTMGCESLAEDNRSPRDKRFQTLVALMLSSQTKDTVTSVAMKNLQQNLPGGLTLESILAVQPAALNELISKVGFHNNKTKFIKAAAEILRSDYASDIPPTIEGLISLPGVGPKMAYLCMSAAWGRDEGIGVDVHVHRITNLWGWHKTKDPEETRAVLESWLPKDKWHDINNLLVGFGQTWCPPVGRKCDECKLSGEGLCPSAVLSKPAKVKIKKETVLVKHEDEEAASDIPSATVVEAASFKVELSEPQGSISQSADIPDIEDIGDNRRRSQRLGK